MGKLESRIERLERDVPIEPDRMPIYIVSPVRGLCESCHQPKGLGILRGFGSIRRRTGESDEKLLARAVEQELGDRQRGNAPGYLVEDRDDADCPMHHGGAGNAAH